MTYEYSRQRHSKCLLLLRKSKTRVIVTGVGKDLLVHQYYKSKQLIDYTDAYDRRTQKR